MKLKNLISTAALCCSVSLLAACSSSSDSPATTSVSGSIFASHVSDATVVVTDGVNEIAGPVTTSSSGTFTVSIPNSNLSSDLVFQSTGGTFIDEATAASTNASDMATMVPAGSLSTGSSVHTTPGSSIIHQLMITHGKTMTEAEDAFNSAFGYIPDSSIAPTDVTSPDADADESEMLAGLRAAAFSQLTMDLGLTADQQFNLFTALALDLSDGTLDGMSTTGAVNVGSTTLPVDIQSKFTNALLTMYDNTKTDTGLNPATIGNLPFATTVITTNYKVVYSAMMDAMQGKHTFKLTITDPTGTTPETGLSPSLMPKMFMADRTHSTPFVDFNNNGDGTYTAVVYYLMPSVMMTGDSMGYWELAVDINSGETARFYPTVMMSMPSNTTRVQLKGVTDMIMDMTGNLIPRPYNIFRDDLSTSGGGTSQFDVFIAPMETMMSFPALETSMTLMSGMGGTPLTVTGVTVEASDDDGSSWKTGSTDGTSGIWSFSGLSLNSGENTIRVKLTVTSTVNTEVKTTDGQTAVADTNDFATFTVTLP